jgi:CBS domain-containing protein
VRIAAIEPRRTSAAARRDDRGAAAQDLRADDIPIGDEPVAIGVITDRDITRAQLAGAHELAQMISERVMTPDPLVLCEDEAVEEALERMRARGVRRAPVMTAYGVLVGVISTDDLIAQLARELTALAHLLDLQPIREALREGPPRPRAEISH